MVITDDTLDGSGSVIQLKKIFYHKIDVKVSGTPA